MRDDDKKRRDVQQQAGVIASIGQRPGYCYCYMVRMNLTPLVGPNKAPGMHHNRHVTVTAKRRVTSEKRVTYLPQSSPQE
jgi:hypothetical protein